MNTLGKGRLALYQFSASTFLAKSLTLLVRHTDHPSWPRGPHHRSFAHPNRRWPSWTKLSWEVNDIPIAAVMKPRTRFQWIPSVNSWPVRTLQVVYLHLMCIYKRTSVLLKLFEANNTLKNLPCDREKSLSWPIPRTRSFRDGTGLRRRFPWIPYWCIYVPRSR